MEWIITTPGRPSPDVRTVHADGTVTCLEIDWHRAELRFFGNSGVSWDDADSGESIWPEIRATAESLRAGWQFWSAMPLRDSLRVTFIRLRASAPPRDP